MRTSVGATSDSGASLSTLLSSQARPNQHPTASAPPSTKANQIEFEATSDAEAPRRRM